MKNPEICIDCGKGKYIKHKNPVTMLNNFKTSVVSLICDNCGLDYYDYVIANKHLTKPTKNHLKQPHRTNRKQRNYAVLLNSNITPK